MVEMLGMPLLIAISTTPSNFSYFYIQQVRAAFHYSLYNGWMIMTHVLRITNSKKG